jgi:response regulator RpfG family c-di-GMP phosphodiesterase
MISNSEAERPVILLVDDEPDILNSLRGLLRRDFQVLIARSGTEALEMLLQHEVHVIMTDQRMPEMSGAELLCQASQASKDSVRIIFTGYADIKGVVEAVNQAGLFRYITKPWDPDDLVDTLHDAAEEYELRQRQRRLLVDVHEFLDDTLKESTESTSRPTPLRQRGEALRARLEMETQSLSVPPKSPVE